ncbi:OPT oligopeptide transporter protein-domain-containing protein [Vararia minispora EC-137]|uniref:OPT oligopeptide transporter protein-domain-containing protein n=1 Tax=Vararia minispora EC-137 TaxID=1314806 RepID=A0ACB8QDR6_9AGAM|nr:OPT oligopeptide transporter protein-domain-containing protein [Vararia minispora EC-137]
MLRPQQGSIRSTYVESESDFDPNFDADHAEFDDDSPYPEVRAAVANYDDPEMAASTIRAWTLGIVWAMILPGINQFFLFRYPSIYVTSLVAQLLSFPMGRLWARFVPRVTVFGLSLNPGSVFTIKEHVLVTIMAGVGAQSAYATEIVAVQKVYFGQSYNFIYSWMLVMSTQLIGFSIGGIARRFLVSPPSMIWPNTLVMCALFNTLHSLTYSGAGVRSGISRERFFAYACAGAMLWYFVPGYLFQALSFFTWMCWILPRNVVVNQLFGYRSGLGYSLISFDWSQIAYIGSPLATPWWSCANVFISFVLFYWILTPALYYTNVWWSSYLPLSSRNAYDNTGQVYDLERILNPDGTLNEVAYQSYSPLFLSTTFAVSYGLSFASITATVVHALIYFYKPIKRHFGQSLREQPDIHAQLMARYRQGAYFPEWWYACIFVVTFTFGCLCIKLWPTGMTIWAFIIALIIGMYPRRRRVGMIQAITNKQVGLNVLSELLIGFMLPGKPVAMMMCTWAYITMSQAMTFTADFKLGHYMKVPPIPMFFAQIVSTIVAGTTQLGVQTWHRPWNMTFCRGLCSANQPQRFICPNISVFGTASIIWGVIGPQNQFARGQIYYGLVFFFIVGAMAPIIIRLITKRYPHHWLNYAKYAPLPPLIFAGLQNLPPANASNYVTWALTGFIFQYLIRRRHFSFWAKYNYVLSAALETGTALGTIIVFFCLQYPMSGNIGIGTIGAWWGNTVFMRTADWNGTAFKILPEGQKFGHVSLHHPTCDMADVVI